MRKIIHLVRHAEPVAVHGRKGNLSANGIQQATRIAIYLLEKVKSKDVAILYAPVLRCQQTALIIGEVQHVQPQASDLRFHNVDRLIFTDIESKFSSYLKFYQQAGAESPKEYIQRFLQLIKNCEQNEVIVVGNEVNIRLLLQEFAPTLYNRNIKHAECFTVSLEINNDTA